MKNYVEELSGGDIRSIGKSNSVAASIHRQEEFDSLFTCLFHDDEVVVMRAADAIEKASILHPEFLITHQEEIFTLSADVSNKELQWHLALLLARFSYHGQQLQRAWNILVTWVKDKKNSLIVRVNALQGLFELTLQDSHLNHNFQNIMMRVGKENIPSMNARIRKLQAQFEITRSWK